jgi:hypothetical protein
MCLLLSRYAQNLSPGIMASQFRLAASSTVIANRSLRQYLQIFLMRLTIDLIQIDTGYRTEHQGAVDRQEQRRKMVSVGVREISQARNGVEADN